MPPIAEMIADPRLVAIPAAAAAKKGVQWMWIGLGGFLVLAGIVIAPLPGPFGLPVSLLGLVVILRNSSSAKRSFIRMQRRHPKVLFPVRRMIRGKVFEVLWRQTLKIERFVLRRRDWRVLRRVRLAFARR